MKRRSNEPVHTWNKNRETRGERSETELGVEKKKETRPSVKRQWDPEASWCRPPPHRPRAPRQPSKANI
ncbi:hypothetical protein MATL_G00124800 [Megalops atlanticus]|uniref:Uncharacterized protein n=1 Tax=Megalops atlanticus TaxID=7932 RepID=A0A9D3PV91_MEGAT|nr:hypothetical protein MATL_G00124800 [Megalops atlanticus]